LKQRYREIFVTILTNLLARARLMSGEHMSKRFEPNHYLLKPDPLYEEDLDFEIDFFEKVLSEDPQHTEALVQLGNAYAKKGMLKKSLELDKKYVSFHPSDPVGYYNLSCNYALMGKKKLALDTLEKSIDLGYDNYEHLKNDPDLDNIRRCLRFRKILWKLLHLNK